MSLDDGRTLNLQNQAGQFCIQSLIKAHLKERNKRHKTNTGLSCKI